MGGRKGEILDTVFLHENYHVPKIITNIIVLIQNKPQILFQPPGLVFYTCHHGKAFLRAIFTLNSFIIRRYILIFLFFPPDVCMAVFLPAVLLSLPPRRPQQNIEEGEGKMKFKMQSTIKLH